MGLLRTRRRRRWGETEDRERRGDAGTGGVNQSQESGTREVAETLVIDLR